MAKLGVITLELDSKGTYLANFLENLGRVSKMDIADFDYTSLEKVDDSIDILVLSPGNAPVGLDTDKRFQNHPQIRPFYEFIRNSIEGGKPLLGINAGHEALNCAYGWAIDKIQGDLKDDYQKNKVLDLSSINDPILIGVEDIKMQLSNDYAVLPLEKQAVRPLQDKVTPLVDFMSHPLISIVNSESEAPV